MEDENTGQEPRCPVCGASEWWDCGHLVADFDLTFGECHSGEFYDRDHEFWSVLEEAMLTALAREEECNPTNEEIQQIWNYAKAEFSMGDEEIERDTPPFFRLVIDLLEKAGAEEHPGSLVDPGGPGMTSSVTLLFSEKPKAVVDEALKLLEQEIASLGSRDVTGGAH